MSHYRYVVTDETLKVIERGVVPLGYSHPQSDAPNLTFFLLEDSGMSLEGEDVAVSGEDAPDGFRALLIGGEVQPACLLREAVSQQEQEPS